MQLIMRHAQIFALAVTLSFGMSLVGCSSNASEEELRQLNDLKAEVASLESQVSAKEKEKANLEKQVAEKNGKLQQCNADQTAVRESMK